MEQVPHPSQQHRSRFLHLFANTWSKGQTYSNLKVTLTALILTPLLYGVWPDQRPRTLS